MEGVEVRSRQVPGKYKYSSCRRVKESGGGGLRQCDEADFRTTSSQASARYFRRQLALNRGINTFSATNWTTASQANTEARSLRSTSVEFNTCACLFR